MNPDRLKQFKKLYDNAGEKLDGILVAAFLEIYESITGKKASARLEEKLHEVVRYDQ